jgi:hypothetical protein
MSNLETRKMQKEMPKIPTRTAMMTMKKMKKRMERAVLQESPYFWRETKLLPQELP